MLFLSQGVPFADAKLLPKLSSHIEKDPPPEI